MHKVIVFFDNMVDEEYSFVKECEAAKCAAQLKLKYSGKRLYRVEVKYGF